jgi:sn-2 palmitoyl-lipid 9-desaturase
VVDLAKDPVHRFLQRYHIFLPLALAGLLLALGEAWRRLGVSWLVWGMFVRTALLYHATWLVNSATHYWDYRSYATRDCSTDFSHESIAAYGRPLIGKSGFVPA